MAFYGHTVAGWTSVIGVMLIVSAFQFLAMSIMAQYLGMVFEETKRRPLYVLKQTRIASHGRRVDVSIDLDPALQRRG